MSSPSDQSTRATLLYRVRALDDQTAWNEFVERYTPLIYGWCVRQGLQSNDAADVTQDVLARLVKAMHAFEYNASRGSFRGWLKTVTNNAVTDLIRVYGKGDRRGSGDSQIAQKLNFVAAKETVNELIRALESQHEQEVLALASARVQSRVQPHTWQAYFQTAVQQRPSNEVAAELGMPISEVYVAKSRVIRRLKKEVATLMDEPTESHS